MGADLYILALPSEPQIGGFEVSENAVNAGYFRDCYNKYGLFARLGLSWWRTYDNYKLGENDSKMKPEQIPQFRAEIVAAWKKARIKDREYREWYTLLIKFLDLAESLNSEIDFWV